MEILMSWINALSDSWNREYPGLDTSALPPLVRLARASILLENFQQAALEPFELTNNDYAVLAALRRAGEPYALNPSQLRGRLDRSSGGMTKMLKRLEQRALVTREPDPKDGRGAVVSLTEEGFDLQDRAFHSLLTGSQDVLALLPGTRRTELERSMRSLLEAFETLGVA
jgi:DNA-binding MarR family transcriptional regulator